MNNQEKDNLLKQLTANGVEEDCLDDLVHDAASSLASAANNGGVASQVEFLVGQGFTADDIRAAVLGEG